MEVRDALPSHYKNRRLPWEPINIVPLGDLQYGSEGCDLPKLKDYIQEGLDKNAYFGFMGDAHDVMSPSNRRKYQNAGFYDNATDWYENKMMEDIEYLYEDVLKPTRGRWLWWLEGHHFWEFSDGSTTDTELCRRLEAPFVGTCGFLRATFHQEPPSGKGGKSLNCDIWCHHGAGGGTTVGAVNWNESQDHLALTCTFKVTQTDLEQFQSRCSNSAGAVAISTLRTETGISSLLARSTRDIPLVALLGVLVDLAVDMSNKE
jgi:hypothetical protein